MMSEPDERIEVACPECGREFDVQAKAGFYHCPDDSCEGWVFIDAYHVLIEQQWLDYDLADGSVFPGIGLLDRAFEELGFCVVRGPDKLWGGDIKSFHPPPGKFDGIIGGPPCQCFSRLRYFVAYNRKNNPGKYAETENLIPEFVRCVEEAQPAWWLMENVPGVPAEAEPMPAEYQITTLMLNNRWLPETTPQNRLRKFWFGHQTRAINLAAYIEVALFEPVEWESTVLASGTRTPRHGRKREDYRLEDFLALQGLPENFLEDAPFTVAGKKRVLGNGVSLPMGRAIARAVMTANQDDQQED
jgi:DNA (cytosine-5)-methyltransferase 1